ncbi:hypothetical protein ACFYR1_13260 [Streptomyces canus]|uniref:hypothetical protein n=1 Tax=Streptomyces canus TaxID=58343 RepID=UPI0036BE79FF
MPLLADVALTSGEASEEEMRDEAGAEPGRRPPERVERAFTEQVLDGSAGGCLGAGISRKAGPPRDRGGPVHHVR